MNKHSILLGILGLVVAGCTTTPKSPEGVRFERNISDELIVLIDEGTGIIVRQSDPDGRVFMILNEGESLEVTQLENGDFPRSMKVFGPDRAELTFYLPAETRRALIRDESGNGIPDLKVEEGRRYRVEDIEWVEVD